LKILGIDPGYETVGFGVIELVNSEWEAVDFGVIKTSKDLDFPERLLQIYDDLLVLINNFKPDLFAIEELFFVKNITNGLKVSEARGVMILAARQNEIPICEYAPNEVKMCVTGYGQAGKVQIQRTVQVTLNLAKKPQPDDAADALAIALTCGFDRVRI